ncbi:UNKNOWN [Stylonychia lemnae]|uniref:Uncharacterized protein n=1 Tax=Stylonychia lemnae TaxID=5949 RepID=A0A078AG35_STYLE|nr:UNKNOWN [Stylonychia lemnae]|eukprot:CDW81184.1 UNKNOWN [Stylonychia lemnae]
MQNYFKLIAEDFKKGITKPNLIVQCAQMSYHRLSEKKLNRQAKIASQIINVMETHLQKVQYFKERWNIQKGLDANKFQHFTKSY